MINVLFICAANINRSPMAEAIFRYMLQAEGLTDTISVDSAAIGNGHVGQKPFWGTQRILRQNNIPFDGIVAKQVTKQDIENAQYVIVMDNKNLNGLKMMGFDINAYRLLDFAPEFGQDVPDPSITRQWKNAFYMINIACKNLLQFIKERENINLKGE